MFFNPIHMSQIEAHIKTKWTRPIQFLTQQQATQRWQPVGPKAQQPAGLPSASPMRGLLHRPKACVLHPAHLASTRKPHKPQPPEKARFMQSLLQHVSFFHPQQLRHLPGTHCACLSRAINQPSFLLPCARLPASHMHACKDRDHVKQEASLSYCFAPSLLHSSLCTTPTYAQKSRTYINHARLFC